MNVFTVNFNASLLNESSFYFKDIPNYLAFIHFVLPCLMKGNLFKHAIYFFKRLTPPPPNCLVISFQLLIDLLFLSWETVVIWWLHPAVDLTRMTTFTTTHNYCGNYFILILYISCILTLSYCIPFNLFCVVLLGNDEMLHLDHVEEREDMLERWGDRESSKI